MNWRTVYRRCRRVPIRNLLRSMKFHPSSWLWRIFEFQKVHTRQLVPITSCPLRHVPVQPCLWPSRYCTWNRYARKGSRGRTARNRRPCRWATVARRCTFRSFGPLWCSGKGRPCLCGWWHSSGCCWVCRRSVYKATGSRWGTPGSKAESTWMR